LTTRVLILGGGLGGLCAGWALLEQSAGELEVELLERGHVLGGKASSMPHHQDGSTYEIDHGYHAFFEYPNLGDLLRRLGDWNALKPNDHSMNMFWRGSVKRFRPWPLPAPLHLLPTAWLIGPAAGWHFFRFYLASALFRLDRVSDTERQRLDELRMEDYARGLGMPDDLIESQLFRFFSRSAFNWPYPTSTLAMLRAIRLVSQNYESLQVRYLDGTSGSVIIDPIARGFEAAGGNTRRFTQVVGIDHFDNRVTGVQTRHLHRFPHSAERAHGDLSFYHSTLDFDDEDSTPERLEADWYLSALPPGDLTEVIDDNAKKLPYFSNIARIQTQPTIAYQVYYDRIVTGPEFNNALVAIPGPFSTIFDRAQVWSHPDGAGSVLELVGEVGDHTEHSSEELMALGDEQISRFCPAARDATVLKRWFHKGGHDAFTMTTTGSDALRPGTQSPFDNLVLAGDFTNNRFGVMSMEGAVTSGLEAANRILVATGYPEYPIRDLPEPGGLLPVIRWLLRHIGLFDSAVGYSEKPDT